jgi:hypothetical protein
MTEILRADICVIGAGSAGLSVAAGASQLGAGTVLIESHKMGGDCLNFGCVPSKALLAAAHAAQSARQAGGFGVKLPPPMIDFAAVSAHVHGVIAGIAPHDSQERFEGLGATAPRLSPDRGKSPPATIASGPAASSSPQVQRPSCRRCRGWTSCPISPTRPFST